jgi:G6PDH family F420-dependent oxidoreductase
MAGRIGDGLISTAPKRELVDEFRSSGGGNKPRLGQVTVCWAESEQQAIDTAYDFWPTAALRGELSQELPLPAHFEQAVQLVTKDDVAEAVICGNDPQRHLQAIQEFIDAGYEQVYIHQVGPDQEGFIRFYERYILPEFAQQTMRR